MDYGKRLNEAIEDAKSGKAKVGFEKSIYGRDEDYTPGKIIARLEDLNAIRVKENAQTSGN